MAAMRGIYVWSAGYPGTPGVASDLRGSGFTTAILWCVHVTPEGDLVFNDTPIVTGGTYVGDGGWGAFLASLKEQPTSIDRVLLSVGSGGGPQDFTNIAALLGTAGGTAALEASFRALRAALPAVDGIDLDDEDDVEPGVLVGFSQLVARCGFAEVTFCPYSDQAVWAKTLSVLGRTNPGLVTGINLQCYAGGAFNDPREWAEFLAPYGDAPVYPGLWCRNDPPGCAEGDCPSDVAAQLAAWTPPGAAPLPGAWIWRYDDILACAGTPCCAGPADTAAYAAALETGLRPGQVDPAG